MSQNYKDTDPQETQEWLESIDDALEEHGYDRTRFLLEELIDYAQTKGARLPFNTNTPFINTIQPKDEPEYPGDQEIERRIKSIIRWNAMAMVVRANTNTPGIGGHISTYASSANLYEVAFNHFFKGPDHPSGGDLVFFQGHGSPGQYSRAYLEGRLTEENLESFRRELTPGGLSSYPHPYLMPALSKGVGMKTGLLGLALYENFLSFLRLSDPQDMPWNTDLGSHDPEKKQGHLRLGDQGL